MWLWLFLTELISTFSCFLSVSCRHSHTVYVSFWCCDFEMCFFMLLVQNQILICCVVSLIVFAKYSNANCLLLIQIFLVYIICESLLCVVYFVFYFFFGYFLRYVLMLNCFLYLQSSTMSLPNSNNDNRGDKPSDEHFMLSDNMDDLFSEYPLTQVGVFNALFCFFLQ